MSVVSVSRNTKSYKDLKVWQKSVELAVEIYEITTNFPANQQYGLRNQVERSVVSVSSNLAEGAGRSGKKEFIYHISIARGSLYELHTQILIANKVGFLTQEKTDELVCKIEEVGKMLNGLKRSLEN